MARAIEAKAKTLKIPTTIGACGDMLYSIREKRLEVERNVGEMKKDEETLKQHIILNLPKHDVQGVKGKIANVSISTEEEPTAENWDDVWAYVKKNNAWELLQRRLNSSAVKERWEAGKKVPGVGKYTVVKVSCTKIGAK
jgi:hypothetical protein